MTLRSFLKQASARVMPEPIAVIRGPVNKRQIALTFDDGPDDMTSEYLSLFDKLGLRATFFLIGKRVANFRSRVLDLVGAGHEVFGHGYTHTKFTELPAETLRREIEMTTAVLPVARQRALRPPGGIFSAATLARTALLGYRTILWSHDSKDATEREPSRLCEYLAPERVRNGDIVLLHEGQPWTLAAMPRVVAALRDSGYELVTVGEMLKW